MSMPKKMSWAGANPAQERTVSSGILQQSYHIAL